MGKENAYLGHITDTTTYTHMHSNEENLYDKYEFRVRFWSRLMDMKNYIEEELLYG